MEVSSYVLLHYPLSALRRTCPRQPGRRRRTHCDMLSLKVRTTTDKTANQKPRSPMTHKRHVLREAKLIILRVALLPLTFIITTGCSQGAASSVVSAKTSNQLAPPEEAGVLEVATRNGSTTYYLDRHENPTGPEYSLVSQFAASKGWTVNWTMYDSTSAVLQALKSGNTHMAAAGLTHLPSRSQQFTRGPAHTEIIEQLVCHRQMRPMPRMPENLSSVDITVTADSSYVETLNKLASEHEGILFTDCL